MYLLRRNAGVGRMSRLDWRGIILPRAHDLVAAATYGVTLRRLFYLLLEDPILASTCPEYRAKVRRQKPGKQETYGQDVYKRLSDVTSEARREGWFPDLLDHTRKIHRYRSFDSPEQAIGWLPEVYRRDRTEGQDVSLYLGVEKATYIDYLLPWFGDLGIPILPCGGYTSQTFTQTIVRDLSGYQRPDGRQRPAVLIYAGDFDPSGLDIQRDLVERTNCWDEVIRVGLNYEQLAEFNLPENPGKDSDSRKDEMIRRYGRNIQVELEALDEEVLRGLYQDAINQFWDASAHEAVLEQEDTDTEALRRWGQ
jgi:hypothetical protein